MLSRIRERKLVRWVVAYLAAAWLLLQVLDLVAEGFGWDHALRIGLVLAALGLPAVFIIGWYHGEKGRQKATPLELVLLSTLALLTGFTLYGIGIPRGDLLDGPPAVAPAALDSLRYVVLPFRHEGHALDDLQEDLLLHDALARWRGIEVVDLFQVRDAAARHPGPLDSAAGEEIARLFGAGRFVRGDLTPVGRGLRFHAALHDTQSGRTLADTTVMLTEREGVDDGTSAAVAARLLFRGAGPADAFTAIDPATTSFPARAAFLKGHEELQRWDLDLADSLFGVALREDPGYVRASLWRAQVRNWKGVAPVDLLGAAEMATHRRDRLTDRERLLTEAMLHLARGAFAEACAAYDALRRTNERDFAAWYGLGECRARDSRVVRDAGSPSGWAFRSSYHRAVEAYRRAFELMPLAHRGFETRTFERISDLFYVSTGKVRAGWAAAPDTGYFVARPALVTDTLAFVAYRVADFARGDAIVAPVSHWSAVSRQRRVFRSVAQSWVTAFPHSPVALEALALAQELLGELAALETLREARRLAEHPRHAALIAAKEIHLLLKLGGTEYVARARHLADSVLAAGADIGGDEATDLAVTAALTGKVFLAAQLAGRGATSRQWPVDLPVIVTSPAEALLAYSVFGGPADSVAALGALIESAIRNRIPPQDQDAVRHALLDRPASLAVMGAPLPRWTELAQTSNYALLRAQAAHARGETERAREILGRLAQMRTNRRVAELSPDAVYPEAWLRAAIADTAAAEAMLDSTLNAMRWFEPGHLDDVARAGSLVQAMALRAEIAAKRGDAPVARMWARAVATLWAGSDEPLRPVVRRMSLIIETGGFAVAAPDLLSIPPGDAP